MLPSAFGITANILAVLSILLHSETILTYFGKFWLNIVNILTVLSMLLRSEPILTYFD